MADALADIEARGHRALLVGGTGLYLRAVVDGLDAAAGSTRRCGPSSTPSPTRRALHARLAELDPVGGDPDGADEPAPGRAGPRGDRSAAAARSPSARASRPIRRRRSARSGSACPGTCWPTRIRAAFAAQLEAGFVDEVRALLARPAGPVPHRPPGARLPGAPRPPRGRRAARRGGRPRRSPHPPVRPCASESLVPPRPPHRWVEPPPRTRLAVLLDPCCETSGAHDRRPLDAHQAPRPRQRLPRARSTSTPASSVAARPGAGRSATGRTGVGADGLIRRPPRPRRRRRRRHGALQRRRQLGPR